MAIPTNIIIIWSGAINEIPNGWFLCNGTNGTPNLQDRFIVGAGNLYSLDDSGGSADAILPEHSHTGSTNTFSHSHPAQKIGGSTTTGGFFGSTFATGTISILTSLSGGHGHNNLTSSTVGEADGTGKNLPPYYSLAYIMYGGE